MKIKVKFGEHHLKLRLLFTFTNYYCNNLRKNSCCALASLAFLHSSLRTLTTVNPSFPSNLRLNFVVPLSTSKPTHRT